MLDGFDFFSYFVDDIVSLWVHPNQNGGKIAHALDLRKLTKIFLTFYIEPHIKWQGDEGRKCIFY